MIMNGSRALALASVPAAAGLAWQQYRRALDAVETYPAAAPDLPGTRRRVPARWGTVTYRWLAGDPRLPALVLIHGWGKTADSAWWPVLPLCTRTMIVVDLPGHGWSELQEPFSFALAAEAVERAVDHAGIARPVLVGHSMGGPVALTVVRRTGAAAFSGLLALATSAYWVRPRLRAMMVMAPHLMAPHSPFLLRTERAELRHDPEHARYIAWAYTRRPDRRILDQTAAALRRFDAREWTDLALPPTTWVVATLDGVLAPEHQMASARRFATRVVEVASHHSMVVHDPQAVARMLEGCGRNPAA